jgi:hypothetical protein
VNRILFVNMHLCAWTVTLISFTITVFKAGPFLSRQWILSCSRHSVHLRGLGFSSQFSKQHAVRLYSEAAKSKLLFLKLMLILSFQLRLRFSKLSLLKYIFFKVYHIPHSRHDSSPFSVTSLQDNKIGLFRAAYQAHYCTAWQHPETSSIKMKW